MDFELKGLKFKVEFIIRKDKRGWSIKFKTPDTFLFYSNKMMTKDDMYKALVAAKNEDNSERIYSESEARDFIDRMSDEYVENMNNTYKDANEWVDYLCM